MKMRNKGKVHPFITSPSASSSSNNNNNKDSFSAILNLLPAAILALVSALSLDDRQVLAYMINASLNSTNPSSPFPLHNNSKPHRTSPALFDCHCFHCYTSFWSRWDASENREVIHRAIEAFEEHLSSSERFRNVAGKSRRREKMGRRKSDKTAGDGGVLEPPPLISPENQESPVLVVLEVGVAAAEGDGGVGSKGVPEDDVAAAVEAPAAVVRSHKGLARKVLPDVMGIFSSRLWSLWSPNV